MHADTQRPFPSRYAQVVHYVAPRRRPRYKYFNHILYVYSDCIYKKASGSLDRVEGEEEEQVWMALLNMAPRVKYGNRLFGLRNVFITSPHSRLVPKKKSRWRTPSLFSSSPFPCIIKVSHFRGWRLDSRQDRFFSISSSALVIKHSQQKRNPSKRILVFILSPRRKLPIGILERERDVAR